MPGGLRFPHCLKENKGSLFPSQIIFFDVESDNKQISDDEEEARLKFGYALYQETEKKEKTYVREEWKYFSVDVELFEWIWYKFRSRRVLYLISSNIWFDLRVSGLLRLLLRSKFKCVNYFVKGLTQIYIFKNGDKKLVCLNFQNFFRLSVKEIGAIIGRQKKEIDFNTASLEEFKSYCMEDVKIIRDAFNEWRSFCEKYDLGTFGKTLPSQAFNSFRHRFMNEHIYIHNRDVVSKLERQAYFGGRSECFFIGKKNDRKYYYLDINSFYSYVMRNYEYPKKLIYYDDVCSLNKLEKFLKSGCTIASVNLTTSEPIYPVHFNYKTVFPIGTFDTCLSTEGLRRELEKGTINRVWEAAHYESGHIFKKYVDYFWELKKKFHDEKNKGWEHISKLFLNTLYGKFGQMNDEVLWEQPCDPGLIMREVLYHLEEGFSTVHSCFGGMEREVRLSVTEAINSFVGICSHVTEYARLLLWDYIKLTGRENVLYCDTDSLIVNEKGRRNLSRFISPGALGGFKVEGVSRSLIIRGLKDYTFGSISKTKGIRKDALQIDEDTYRQVMFPGYMGEIREGLRPTYRIVHVNKKLSRKYDKGEVLKSGEVIPLELNQSYGKELMR
uniref:DNA-directed DNA polymerase n=1 Tax=viral metagenome TaxID=1070528 RepID=A0A6M3IF59_9ZZZZ